jgi:ribosomal protein S12 methylthiotransferase accessory factor
VLHGLTHQFVRPHGDAPRLLSPGRFGRAGIVSDLRMLRTDVMGSFYSVAVASGRTPSGMMISGAGIDLAAETVKLKAVNEVIERYCLACPSSALVRARYADLREDSIAPRDWPLFTAAQFADPAFPFQPWTDDLSITWCRGTYLLSGRPVWVPAALVWLNNPDRLTAGISTGAATHASVASALLTGIYEVIERDALTILWEARASPPLVDAHAPWQCAEVADLAGALRQAGLTLLLRDMTTDLGVAAVLAVIHDAKGRRPALAIGSAARRQLASACRQAAREAFLTWTWMGDEHRRRRVDRSSAYEMAALSSELIWQAYLYGFPEMLDEAGHLLADGPAAVSGDKSSDESGCDAAGELAQICDQFTRGCRRLIAVNITTPDVASLGLHTVKALIPGLVPLSIGRYGRALSNPRIADIPSKLGWIHAGTVPHGRFRPLPLP